MEKEPIDRVRVRTREGDRDAEREDVLAVEEPLEIRVRGEESQPTSLVTTMRTPGNDEELAAGLLFAEGVLSEARDLVSLERPSDPRIDPDLKANVLIATLTGEAASRAAGLQRGTVMGSACGVCGKTSIENVIPSDRPPLASALRVAPELLYALPALLRERQSVFARTGGLHAAGLFSAAGELLEVREDIGRHNATDKIVGSALLAGRLPLTDRILLVSGRTGFEIVQKAFAAGIPFVASVSAPSSLAAALAESAGVTLVGFLRERRFNVYSGKERVLRDSHAPRN
ncbi:MAG TPA: formate dehydrogenase accessory sulfurtransferase FdhD [Thermoanaerobaculia bacterium]|nr:formate dehydrogenase accessory sulfurtransferase FdhD [Thermoanaerobaculia bacterium]